MLYYKATAGLWGEVFLWESLGAQAHRPRLAPASLKSLVLGRAAAGVQRCCRPRCRPPPLLRHPLSVRPFAGGPGLCLWLWLWF